jgi:acyl phosphate:glycerol-3-phosphate acyltransferase
MSWSGAGLGLMAGLALLGYVLGSIPFGLLLTRMAGLGDIRAIGSGNIGATNVLRTGNKVLAAATLLLDALKGVAAVLIARALTGGEDFTAPALAGAMAFLGHCFPVWLKFQGGKGVATFIGIIFALAWPVGIAFGLTWLLVAFCFRISSLAALVAAVVTPLYGYAAEGTAMALACALMAAIILWRHQANLQRLWAGTEPKIGRTA